MEQVTCPVCNHSFTPNLATEMKETEALVCGGMVYELHICKCCGSILEVRYTMELEGCKEASSCTLS